MTLESSSGPHERGTVTDLVTSVLRREIVTLELRPGAVVDRNLISVRFGVSRFPVSEALNRLRDEGLVEIRPQIGSIVAPIRIADVLDHMSIRRALECEAVALAAASPDDRLVDALAGDIRRLRNALRRKDPVSADGADKAFHNHLADHLELPRFKVVFVTACVNLDRASLLTRTGVRWRKVLDEHDAILDAVENGDVSSARDAVRIHLDGMIVSLLAFARAHPEQFADSGERIPRFFAALAPGSARSAGPAP